MLIVLYVDKPGAEYEKFLDVLFLSVGLLNPAGTHFSTFDVSKYSVKHSEIYLSRF